MNVQFFKDFFKSFINDARTQGLLIGLVNVLWAHFIPPQYGDILVIVDGLIIVIVTSIVAAEKVQVTIKALNGK